MFRKLVTWVLAHSGITVGGDKPQDLTIAPYACKAIALNGSLGLADAYANGDVMFNDIDAFFTTWLEGRKKSGRALPGSPAELLLRFKMWLINDQNRTRAWRVGREHYDLGNDLYRPMVGPSMAYSNAYWATATNLDQAQEHKYRMIFEKMNLKPGQSVLEIGCGWGGLAAYFAQRGIYVTGFTVSKEQAAYIEERYADLVAQGTIKVHLADYRDIPKLYARMFHGAISVGMFEHVGPKNYRTYMRIVSQVLRPGGRFLLHTIVGNGGVDPFIYHRIFPSGILPLEEQIAKAAGKTDLVIEDMHNFGHDYSKTLAAWWHNFEKAWPTISASNPEKYDTRFYRIWKFYLKSCAAAFAVRRIQLEQWVFVKGGEEGGYQSIRPAYNDDAVTKFKVVS